MTGLLLALLLARLVQLEVLARRRARSLLAGSKALKEEIVRGAQIEEALRTASHELRTPLTTIKGFLELIAEGDAGPVTDTQREFLEIATRSTDRLTAVIDDLLGSVRAMTFSSRGSSATEGPSAG